MTKKSITLVANIALTLTVFVGSSVLAQISAPNPLAGRIPDGVENALEPIHVFQMDGSVKDDVENISATASNNVTSVKGYIGGAMHFDGTSYAEVPIAVSALDVPDMTFVAMVKLDDLPDDPDELSAVASGGHILSVGADTNVILSNQKKSSANIYVSSASAYVGDSKLFATPQGIWHMVAMTRKIEDRTTDDGEKTPHTILNLYINGRIEESVKEYKRKAVEPRIFFGARSAGSGSKFRGSIDQVAFYDRALSKDELDEMRGNLRTSARGANNALADRDVMETQDPMEIQDLMEIDAADGEENFPSNQFESGNVDSRNSRLLPGEREPVDTADDFEELMDTPEGRSLVQTVDWEFVGLALEFQFRWKPQPGDLCIKQCVPKSYSTSRWRGVLL